MYLLAYLGSLKAGSFELMKLNNLKETQQESSSLELFLRKCVPITEGLSNNRHKLLKYLLDESERQMLKVFKKKLSPDGIDYMKLKIAHYVYFLHQPDSHLEIKDVVKFRDFYATLKGFNYFFLDEFYSCAAAQEEFFENPGAKVKYSSDNIHMIETPVFGT